VVDANIVGLIVAILVTYFLLKYWKEVLRIIVACIIGLAIFGIFILWKMLHL
jgi:hypothetical protein